MSQFDSPAGPAGQSSPAAPGSAPAAPPTVAGSTAPAVPKSRTGMVWVTVCAGALIAIALIVFLVQNTHQVRVHFLGLAGTTSLALMLLIAALAGVLLTLILGSARIIQLRRTLRHRESAKR
ncbi:MAG: LapA family protein [Blastococcus sp.]